jgi:hypothetical protein
MTARRCVVIVPYLTHVEPACERRLRELEGAGYEVRRQRSHAGIDLVRSTLATTALAEGFDELLWIDSDMEFSLDAVDRLRARDLAFVAGVYAKRGGNDFAVHRFPETTELKLGDDGGLYDVRYVGCGFVCVRREVYADVARTFALPTCTAFAPPVVPYYLPMVISDPDGNRYLGEDYAFCERARRAGHRIVIDTTIRLGHIGAYTYQWEDAVQTVPRALTVTLRFDRDK